jgi:hypothetical protein
MSYAMLGRTAEVRVMLDRSREAVALMPNLNSRAFCLTGGTEMSSCIELYTEAFRMGGCLMR